MFAQETVFVIGAGASHELGLPLGSELKTDIASLLDIRYEGSRQRRGDYEIANSLKALAREREQPHWNDLHRKCWLLRDALPGSLSIDNLLDAHKADSDVSFIGKLAISKAILSAERKSRIFIEPTRDRPLDFRDIGDTWLLQFFQLATEGVSKDNALLAFENVTLINFNYDRCVEQFMPAGLSTYYGFNMNEATELAGSLKIIHPYGQVGLIEGKTSLSNLSFGAERYNLQNVADGIKTFSEGLHREEDRTAIEDTLRSASKIVFLGFAFHPLNMELLAIEGENSIKEVYGSTLGLSDADVKTVERRIQRIWGKRLLRPGMIPDRSSLRNLDFSPQSASKFLQEYFRSIAS